MGADASQCLFAPQDGQHVEYRRRGGPPRQRNPQGLRKVAQFRPFLIGQGANSRFQRGGVPRLLVQGVGDTSEVGARVWGQAGSAGRGFRNGIAAFSRMRAPASKLNSGFVRSANATTSAVMAASSISRM